MESIKEALTEVKIISDPKEHYFFGYYDLQPYDSKDERHLCHKVSFIDRLPTKDDVCELGYIDIKTGEFVKLSETTAWNFQQGALLQWYKDDNHIAYNVRTEDGFGTEIKNIVTGSTKTLPRAAANISQDGKYGICVNMSRIYDFRPGYGYSDKPDEFYEINSPAEDGVFLMDMESGDCKQIISYQDMIKQFPEEPYSDCKLVVNHITFNPSGNRFLFLLRNFNVKGVSWKTQLITSDLEGNMCKLSDYIFNSHYHWKNDNQILIVTSSSGTEKMNLCLRNDFSGNTVLYDLPELHVDIHCLYSPNQKYILGDGYPDEEKYRSLWIYDIEKNEAKCLLKAYSYPTSTLDIRCDLHARWNHKGDRVSFDSNHIGNRCICEIDLSNIVEY